MFRPTILPFQLQESRGISHTYGHNWATVGRFATLQEAQASLGESYASHLGQRVYCDPEDVTRALYEAGVAIEGHRREAKYAIGEAVRMRGEALEERGSATNSPPQEEPNRPPKPPND